MRSTDQTLLEQMQITEFEIDYRKELLSISANDESVLKNAKPGIMKELEGLIDRFYEMQTSIPEISLLIGDAETLSRLRKTMKSYISDLFSGVYDIEYVDYRLRIGMVHKRIGVEPKLYLTAVQILLKLLEDLVISAIHDPDEQIQTINSLHKIIMFDMTFIFDTYIRSLLMEVKVSREKLSLYASELERKVRTRTIQLEQLSRTDPLTGLLNKRHMEEILTTALRAAQRRNETVTLVYIDINDFKIVNDTQGHQRGDEILVAVAKILKESSRSEDFCFRYGGDEFCVIMANCLMDQARTVWESRVKDLLMTHKEVETSLSIGYAQTGPDKYVSAEELIFLADARMYEEKKRMKES